MDNIENLLTKLGEVKIDFPSSLDNIIYTKIKDINSKKKIKKPFFIATFASVLVSTIVVIMLAFSSREGFENTPFSITNEKVINDGGDNHLFPNGSIYYKIYSEQSEFEINESYQLDFYFGHSIKSEDLHMVDNFIISIEAPGFDIISKSIYEISDFKSSTYYIRDEDQITYPSNISFIITHSGNEDVSFIKITYTLIYNENSSFTDFAEIIAKKEEKKIFISKN